MGLFNLFNKSNKSKKSSSEFNQINENCNSIFEKVFNECRLDFGREMVEIMNMKSRLLEVVNSENTYTPAQGLLAKKFLELFTVYLKIIKVYVSLKKGNSNEHRDLQALESIEEKINRVYSLINELNRQFYLSSDEVSSISSCDDIINEAEALSNIVKSGYLNNSN